MKWTLLLTLLVLGGPAYPDIRGPIAGFYVDHQRGTIRSILGIPGAALIGPDVTLPFTISDGVLSPTSDFALVVSTEDGEPVYLIRALLSGMPEVILIKNALPGPKLLAMNAASSIAVLASRSGMQVQTVTGLPEVPVASAPVNTLGVVSEITTLALDNSGSRLLLGSSDGVQGAVYSLQMQNPVSRLITPAGRPSAILFINGDRDAVIADRVLNQITLVTDVDGSANASPLAVQGDGIVDPTGLQRLSNGQILAVTNADHGLKLISTDPVLNISTIQTDWPVTRCDRLGDGSAILLNEQNGVPLQLLDPTQNGRVFFVPMQQ
jgi:hypothetical protein